MLTKRQTQIFLELCDSEGEYFKANYFATKLDVSLRTVQNDLTTIKEETNKEEGFQIESKVPFGTRIVIKNKMAFQAYLDSIQSEGEETNLSNRDGRIQHLLIFLLSQKRSVSMTKCANCIFVSKSTLLSDLKELEKILDRFSLHLIQSKGYVWIDGLERDKRMCLIENNLAYLQIVPSMSYAESDSTNMDFVRRLLMDEFTKERYYISDLDFQNIIIWINVSLKRIMDYFYLNEEDIDNEYEFRSELRLSTQIFDRIEKHFMVRVPQTEINFLALYIKNHTNFSDSDYISADLNDFILEALNKIKESYPTDFTYDMELRLSLALHCAPMLSRARNNVQIKNEMMEYVKQSFPYAFNVATYFSYLLSERFDCKIKESETAFLAIYFNKSILDHSVLNGNKKICIITSMKRSEYFLMEQLFYDRFQKYISSITFVSPKELDDLDLDQYNLFFSTEDNAATESGLATKINYFLSEKDLEKVRVRIEGFKNIEDMMKLFDPKLFFTKELNSKQEVQDLLVKKAKELYDVPNLSQEITLREEFGSTYFGNGIAVLHPMHSSDDDSFIGEFISKKPIRWDNEGNLVNIVFLVCIAKNNLDAFHVWNYISPLLFNNEFKNRIVSVNSFEEFQMACENQLKSGILK